MKKLSSLFNDINFFKDILNSLNRKKILSAYPMPGSSMECLTSLLSDRYKVVLLLVSDEGLIENIGQNLKSYLNFLGLSAKLIPCLFAGQNDIRCDKAILNDKIRALKNITNNQSVVLLASAKGYNEEIYFSKNEPISIFLNEKKSRDELLRVIFNYGYERVNYVEVPGEFAVRGGILDVYPIGGEWPLRIEFFDNKIELIKEFDPSSQRSFNKIESLFIHKANYEKQNSCILGDYLKEDTAVIVYDYEVLKNVTLPSKNVIFCFDESLYDLSNNEIVCKNNEKLFEKAYKINTGLECYGSYAKGLNNLDSFVSWAIENKISIKNSFISCGTKGEEHRLKTLMDEYINDDDFSPKIFNSSLLSGFIIKEENFALLTDAEIFQRYQTRNRSFKFGKGVLSSPSNSFFEGDYVVHFTHGIGIYRGSSFIDIEGEEKEVLIIEYAEDSKLYVPAEQYFLVEKYVGANNSTPILDKLGALKWSKKKEEAYSAIRDYAAKILKIEAKRETVINEAYYTNLPEIIDFEHSFRFQETKDQESAIIDVKHDLESKNPMNRLILGDAGFGKTEVAIRAAFITAMNGKQTAMLVPTTILAEQHFKTFNERMADYPLRLEVLSRFTPQKNQNKIIEGIKNGSVDVVIGTHRLVQKDISFLNLGLLIIDEEQKFGVVHKDYLLHKNPLINILNLSATPIPRTLYLSLMGIRNMSAIMTPPLERRPIETVVIKEDWMTVKKAIIAEINRNGQVFFVHNRINSIQKVFNTLKNLLPDVTMAVAHGRLHEIELKKVMNDFEDKKIKILIATNIIESGLDLPNVNTLIIHHADKFGLAELYQLRGRVGRFNRKAYAYLMISKDRVIDSSVKRKIDAISEFSKPGGGYHVAMKDLEIRGAGNILGTEQSGHIAAIGFDLYCKLLRDAVKVLKGQSVTPKYEVILLLGSYPHFPNSYIPDFTDRFYYYKQLASSENISEINDLKMEIIDKFGKSPLSVDDLIYNFKIKCTARQKNLIKIEKQGEFLELTYINRNIKKVKLSKYSSIFKITYETLEKL